MVLVAAVGCDAPVSTSADTDGGTAGTASTGVAPDVPPNTGATSDPTPNPASDTDGGGPDDPFGDTDTDTDTDTPEPFCGNGIREAGEACDGWDIPTWEDFGSECEAVTGHSGADGSVRCETDCTLDASACFWCGDGVVEEGEEECDGAPVGRDGEPLGCSDVLGPGFTGETSCDECLISTDACEPLCGNGVLDEGEVCDGEPLEPIACAVFAGPEFDGFVGCDESCELTADTCTPLCGNGVIDEGEDCDGEALGEATCLDFGDLGGALGCTETCSFDTTFCTCGNGLIDEGEACDGLAVATTCDDLIPGVPGAPTCSTTCSLETEPCGIDSGEGLLISEVMYIPLGNPGTQSGEWIELHNANVDQDVSLAGCSILGVGPLENGLLPELEVPAGGYVTLGFGTPDDLGFTPNGALPPASFFFNDGDTIRIECGGLLVDEISYEPGAPWPSVDAGRSIVLEGDALDSDVNDLGSAWCGATETYAEGQYGTPGAPGGC